MANFNFVIDSSFRPFDYAELVRPLMDYKEEYEKREADYLELQKNADKFKYLSETLPEGSKARDVYNTYANALQGYANDFAKNGLSINNKRGLLNMKRRYEGEIGRLEKADEALQKEINARNELRYKDPSMLYANENLTIDDFLDGKRDAKTLYGISGNELYAQAAKAAQSMSSRIYHAGDKGKTLGGYYRDFVTSIGYTPEQVAGFSREMQDRINEDFTRRISSIPELQDAAMQILDSQGVTGNLTGDNLRRAQQQVIRGMVDGVVHQENHNPVRDEGVMSAYQQFQKQQALNSLRGQGYILDDRGNIIGYDEKKDFAQQRDIKITRETAAAKVDGKLPLVQTPAKLKNKVFRASKESQEGNVRKSRNITNNDKNNDKYVEAQNWSDIPWDIQNEIRQELGITTDVHDTELWNYLKTYYDIRYLDNDHWIGDDERDVIIESRNPYSSSRADKALALMMYKWAQEDALLDAGETPTVEKKEENKKEKVAPKDSTTVVSDTIKVENGINYGEE